MKSFRDVLNGRMRTGKGRFVLASHFQQPSLHSCPLSLSSFQVLYILHISLSLSPLNLLSYSPFLNPLFPSSLYCISVSLFIFLFFPFRTASLSFLSLPPSALLLLVFPLHLFSLLFPFCTPLQITETGFAEKF
jgi:hypothetical protein